MRHAAAIQKAQKKKIKLMFVLRASIVIMNKLDAGMKLQQHLYMQITAKKAIKIK